MNSLVSRPYYAYSKMGMEDPEEVQHRRAQFLIHKSLQKSDSIGSQSKLQPICMLKVKVCKLNIKIGRKLKKMRKSILLKFSKGHVVCYKQLICHLKSWKRALH